MFLILVIFIFFFFFFCVILFFDLGEVFFFGWRGVHVFLVFLTTFLPFCPNFCEPSLTPKNLGQWGCSSVQFFMSMDLLAFPLAQDHLVRGGIPR